MILRWTVPAFEDAKHILAHIGEANPDIAVRVLQDLLSAINRLLIFPNLGRPGMVVDKRELVLRHMWWCIVFNLKAIELLRIWHGAQGWK